MGVSRVFGGVRGALTFGIKRRRAITPAMTRSPYPIVKNRAISTQSTPALVIRTIGSAGAFPANAGVSGVALPWPAASVAVRPSARISGVPHRLQLVRLPSSSQVQHLGQQTASGIEGMSPWLGETLVPSPSRGNAVTGSTGDPRRRG